MIEISINKIEQKARELAKNRKPWHFHILTPRCQLNEIGRYAFLLESHATHEVFVAYSDTPYMDLGKRLAPLLHKGVSFKKEGVAPPVEFKEETKRVIERAKRLNQEGKFWHHHSLPPDCIFNDSHKWLIMFENQENKEVLKVFSNEEPIDDLKEIEPLYYQQKGLS